MTSAATSRLVVGCMTGTSIDALDAALVRITGRGLAMTAELLATHTLDLGPLAPRLRALAEQSPATAADIAALARDFSLLHADAVSALLDRAPGPGPRLRPDLICVHGQTVAHRPPLSWQLFNPWPLACATGVPIVFDLRGADLAAGGQGAPITPIADWVLLRAARPRAIVNLGGYCNITLLPPSAEGPEAIRAADLCACNQLLDAIARTRLGVPYDDGGEHALRGRRIDTLFTTLAEALRAQARAGRSLGTGDELAALPMLRDTSLAPDDVAHSACCALGETIADACAEGGAAEIVLAGGGVRNAALVGAIRANAARQGRAVTLCDARGDPGAYREAIAFGVLGALCQDRVAISLPAVTGVATPAPIAGCWVLPPLPSGSDDARGLA